MPQRFERDQISVEFGPRQAGKAHSENEDTENPEDSMGGPMQGAGFPAKHGRGVHPALRHDNPDGVEGCYTHEKQRQKPSCEVGRRHLAPCLASFTGLDPPVAEVSSGKRRVASG